MRNNIIGKKVLAFIGVAVLAFGATACGNTVDDNNVSIGADAVEPDDALTGNDTENQAGSNDNQSGAAVELTDSLQAFTAIWDSYGDNDIFAAVGGDYSSMVDGAPGKCDVSDTDCLVNMFYIPENLTGSVDDMASLLHMMNANTYTGVILHTTSPEGFADALKDNISSINWVCGFPDRLVVADLSGGYFAYAFGEASIMETYVSKLQAAFPSAKLVHDVNLVE